VEAAAASLSEYFLVENAKEVCFLKEFPCIRKKEQRSLYRYKGLNYEEATDFLSLSCVPNHAPRLKDAAAPAEER
jgi:hypothetical protein